MTKPRARLAAAIRTAVFLAVPSAVAMAVFVAIGTIAPSTAVLAWVGIFAGTVVLILPAAAVLNQLSNRRSVSEGAPSTHLIPGLIGRVATAFDQMAREIRQRDDQLDATRQANQTILELLPVPIILMSSDQTISFANQAAETILDEALAGKKLPSVLRAPALLGAANAVIAGAGSQQATFDLGGDTPRRLEGHMRALGDSYPTHGTIALLLHDVTELWRTERLRADFVANASHEIRTPLATLVGAVETVLGPARDDPEARQKFLLMMQEHAERIERLVDDLLSLSRIERIEHEAPQKTVALRAILEQACSALEWKARARGVRMTLDLPDGLAGVHGDSDELAQVFQNLIDNAIKYGDPDSEVRISARPVESGVMADGWTSQGPALAITVADHGPGIAPEHLPRLTERFYRVDKARSRQLGGTGLGLAIVKHIVSRHRGALTIESEPGQGSKFTVFLHAAAKKAEPATVK